MGNHHIFYKMLTRVMRDLIFKTNLLTSETPPNAQYLEACISLIDTLILDNLIMNQ